MAWCSVKAEGKTFTFTFTFTFTLLIYFAANEQKFSSFVIQLYRISSGTLLLTSQGIDSWAI
jgi:hypothetical protein